MSVEYLLNKLYQINKDLGGIEDIERKKQNHDEFMAMKDQALSNLFAIRKGIQQKVDKNRTAEIIKIEIDIKNRLSDAEKLIQKMNEYLRKSKDDKKLGAKEIERRQKIYENLRQQIKDIQLLLIDDNNVSLQVTEGDNSLRLQKDQLIGQKQDRSNQPRDLTDVEKDATNRWKDKDNQMDQQIDVINDNVLKWLDKAKQASGAIDVTIQKAQGLENSIDKTNKLLESSNKQLKDLVAKFGAPHKCCLDITLIVILVGLAYLFIKMM